jgi:hypothetical protein
MQVAAVTSRILIPFGKISVLPSCSNFTDSALGLIDATANSGPAARTRPANSTDAQSSFMDQATQDETRRFGADEALRLTTEPVYAET